MYLCWIFNIFYKYMHDAVLMMLSRHPAILVIGPEVALV